MADQIFSPATGLSSSAHSPYVLYSIPAQCVDATDRYISTAHPRHDDEASLREHRLKYLFRQPSNEDFTSRVLGGASSYDHVGSMKAKLEKLAEQIGKPDDSGSSKVRGDAAQINNKVRKEQKRGQ
ncbi:hypothetical protein DL769_009990 [Monosporascus sp. CRB-8-3]|nr:hypothetical protein DL769_009990 [Monosporascus sp. CRB-8-3]